MKLSRLLPFAAIAQLFVGGVARVIPAKSTTALSNPNTGVNPVKGDLSLNSASLQSAVLPGLPSEENFQEKYGLTTPVNTDFELEEGDLPNLFAEGNSDSGLKIVKRSVSADGCTATFEVDVSGCQDMFARCYYTEILEQFRASGKLLMDFILRSDKFPEDINGNKYVFEEISEPVRDGYTKCSIAGEYDENGNRQHIEVQPAKITIKIPSDVVNKQAYIERFTQQLSGFNLSDVFFRTDSIDQERYEANGVNPQANCHTKVTSSNNCPSTSGSSNGVAENPNTSGNLDSTTEQNAQDQSYNAGVVSGVVGGVAAAVVVFGAAATTVGCYFKSKSANTVANSIPREAPPTYSPPQAGASSMLQPPAYTSREDLSTSQNAANATKAAAQKPFIPSTPADDDLKKPSGTEGQYSGTPLTKSAQLTYL